MSDKEHIIVLQKQVAELQQLVVSLKAELAWYKSNQNSKNSNLPPSHDLHKPIVQKAKKKKSTRNRGGQFGHKCNRLEKVATPNEIIVHHVDVCAYCGEDLTEQPGQTVRTAQVHDIPPIEISVTEHHKISKCCPRCNQTTQSELPGTLNYYDVQYGDRLKNLVTYMSSRQYLSVNRTAEFVSVLTGTSISTGFVWDTVHRKAQQCVSVYENMLEKLKKSPVVGSDETGCRVGGQKAWMWVWCNERYVYLKVSDNRGYGTITEVLGSEQQNFITVSDCFAAQLKLNTPDKQICLAHLLRECEGLHEKYNSQWALLLKSKLEQIIQLTKDKTIAPHTVQILEEELLSILKRVRGRAHEKVRVFRRRLFKLRSYITTCLRNRLVPPTNNMSERALRSTKVKIRVSSLFRTYEGAQDFAILRSIIDSAILQGKHPFNALTEPEIVVL